MHRTNFKSVATSPSDQGHSTEEPQSTTNQPNASEHHPLEKKGCWSPEPPHSKITDSQVSSSKPFVFFGHNEAYGRNTTYQGHPIEEPPSSTDQPTPRSKKGFAGHEKQPLCGEPATQGRARSGQLSNGDGSGREGAQGWRAGREGVGVRRVSGVKRVAG